MEKYPGGFRVICIANLSPLEDTVTRSMYEEKFPKIGESYLVTGKYHQPLRHKWDNTPVYYKLYGFDRQEDSMGVEKLWNARWFIVQNTASHGILCYMGFKPQYPEVMQRIIEKTYAKNLLIPEKLKRLIK